NESQSRVPFYEYKKERRVSSRTFESEQEFLTKMLQKVKGQPQAHAFVKVPDKPGRFVRLPRVRTPWISASTRAAGHERVFSQPFYSRSDEPQTPEKRAERLPAPENAADRERTLPICRGDAALPEPDAAAITKKKEERLLAPAGASALDYEADDNFAGPE